MDIQFSLDPLGRGAYFEFADTAGAPTPPTITALTTVPTITIGATTPALTLPIWGIHPNGRVPYLYVGFTGGVAALATDVVLANAGAAWCTLSTGPAPALVNLAANVAPMLARHVNDLGSMDDRTLPVGWDVNAESYFELVNRHADIARRADHKWTLTSGTGLVQDLLGNVTSLGTGLAATCPLGIFVDNQTGDGKGYTTLPAGTYTLDYTARYVDLSIKLNNTVGSTPWAYDAGGAPTPPADVHYTNGSSVHITGNNATGAYLQSAANPAFHPQGSGTAPFSGFICYRGSNDGHIRLLYDKSKTTTISNGANGFKELTLLDNNGTFVFKASTDGTTVFQCSLVNPYPGQWVRLYFWFSGTQIGMTVLDTGAAATPVNVSTIFVGTSPVSIAGNFTSGADTTISFWVDSLCFLNQLATAGWQSWYLNGRGNARHSTELDGVGAIPSSAVLLWHNFDQAAGSARTASIGTLTLNETITGTGGSTTVAAAEGAQDIPVTSNRAVFTFPKATGSNTVQPSLYLTGTSVVMSSIRVWLPGEATDGTAKWAKETYRRLGVAPHAVRYNQLTGPVSAAGTNLARFSDMLRANKVGLGDNAGSRARTISFTAIGPPSGGGLAFPTFNNYVPMQFTFPGHGLGADGEEGDCLTFASTFTVNLTGGGAGPPTPPTVMTVNSLYVAMTMVVDANTVIAWILTPNGVNYNGTLVPNGVQSIAGTATVRFGAAASVDDVVSLGNFRGSQHWWNIPHGFSDAESLNFANWAVTQVQGNNPTLVEYSNEPWNFAYLQSNYCYTKGIAAGFAANVAQMQYYALRAGQHHTIWKGVFDAAGKSIVRVFNVQATNTAIATQVLDYCSTNSIPVDMLVLGAYWNSGLIETALGAAYDQLDDDQFATTIELWLKHGYTYSGDAGVASLHPCSSTMAPGPFRAHQSLFSTPRYGTSFQNSVVGSYEGGIQFAGGRSAANPITSGTSAVVAANSIRRVRHSRLRACYLYKFKRLKSDGCAVWMEYDDAQVPDTAGGVKNSSTWGKSVAFDQLPGMGDGSDGRFNNRSNLNDVANVVAPIVHAINGQQAVADHAAANLAVTGPATIKAGTTATVTVTGTVDRTTVLTPFNIEGGVYTPASQTISGPFPNTFTATFSFVAATPTQGRSVHYVLSDTMRVAGSSATYSTGLIAPGAIAGQYHRRRRVG